MKKLISGFVIAVSILFVQSSSFALSLPLFGPAKFERTIGKPNTFTDLFQACNTSATYKLVVENGEGGKDRLSSASVSLNGQEVVRENEFNQRVDKVEKTVTLLSENTLDVKLSSGPGGFIKASIYCVSGCLEVNITFPATESAINRSKALVQGSLINASGETGVTFQWSGDNGQWSGLAETQGTSFAGVVSLQQGQNTITATAIDACGYKAHDSITIQTDSIHELIRLTATPSSGIPSATINTLDVNLEADVSIPNPITNYSWDFNGDGTADQQGSALSEVTATYQNPGLYFPTVTVTDSTSQKYTEAAVVNVLSKEVMDALLKGKWAGMQGALINGNISKALNNFAGGQNSKFKEVFEALKDQLPVIFSAEEEFSFVSAYEKRIEYENIVVEGDKAYSYPVIFIRDVDGLWKIKQF